MSDGGGNSGGIKQAVAEVSQAVVEPVKDEGAKMLEAGVSQITGKGQTPLDPQEEARKKEEEAKRRANVLQFIQKLKEDQQRFTQAKTAEEQKKAQQTQEEQQKKQVKQFEVIEKQQKEQSMIEKTGKGRAELKKGIGG